MPDNWQKERHRRVNRPEGARHLAASREYAAVCVDNVDGAHGDFSYGDVEVLRHFGLR